MRAYLPPLTALILVSNFGHAASPVLSIELISRNAQGAQQNGLRDTALNGMSARGSKIAFTVSDRAFFNEPPPPPPTPPGSSDIPQYGQIALWRKDSDPVPLVNFRDGFGATNQIGYYRGALVKLSEQSSRICLSVDNGDLVSGIRVRGLTLVVCGAQPGPPYEYLLGPDMARATGGIYGNEQFDLYHGQFQFGPGVDNVGNLVLKDRQTGVVEFIAVASNGQVAFSDAGDVSNNGRWVVFLSGGNDLVPGEPGNSVNGSGFFLRDRLMRTWRRLLRPNGAEPPRYVNGEYDLSANGRFLVFSSTGDVVEPCLTNFNGLPSQGLNSEPTFVHDFQTNTTECITIAQDGTAFGNIYADEINRVSISGDGRFVVYATRYPADAADTNGQTDIYLRDRKLNRTLWVSQSATGAPGNARSISPLISEDGRWLAFHSYASNLVPNDTNFPPNGDPSYQGGDIFLRDLSALSVEPVQVPAGSNWGWALLVLGLLGFGMRARA